MGSPAITQQIQSHLQNLINRGVPGISATITTSFTSYTFTAGLSNIETSEPITKDHTFGIGSITKLFLGVIILQLIEEGKLSLSDKVSTYLGEEVWHDIPNAECATVGSLLRHESGVPSWEDDPRWIRVARGDLLKTERVWAKDETLSFIRYNSVKYPARAPSPHPIPGQYSYSNTNFTLLGLIAEHITHTIIPTLITTRIIEPLSLSHTYLEKFEVPRSGTPSHRYHWLTPTYLSTAGHPHTLLSPPSRPDLLDVTRSNLSTEWIAGGNISHPLDLSRFALAIRNGKLLTQDGLDMMFDFVPTGKEGVEVGRGVFRMDRGKEGFWLGHNGSVLGFAGSAFWSEERDVAVSVLGNVGTMHAGDVLSAASVITEEGFLGLVLELAGETSRNGI